MGAPDPPCEDRRLATVHALALVEQPMDPEIGSILKAVASIFKAPAALVAKFDQKRVFIWWVQGLGFLMLPDHF